MQRDVEKKGPVRDFTKRHAFLTVLGLVVILVPVAIVGKSVEHAHGVVHKGVTAVTPVIERFGGVATTGLILLMLLLLCWILGLVLSSTQRGQQWIEWEKAKFFTKSPLLQKQSKRKKDAERKEEQKHAEFVLVPLDGGWAPGVVMAEHAGWSTVFLPDVPSTASGRLVCFESAALRPLDVSIDAFRKTLMATGRGSETWLQALAGA